MSDTTLINYYYFKYLTATCFGYWKQSSGWINIVLYILLYTPLYSAWKWLLITESCTVNYVKQLLIKVVLDFVYYYLIYWIKKEDALPKN